MAPPPAEVLCEIHNSLAIVTLNRPAALNALSLGMIDRLGGMLRRFNEDDGIRAVMLRGAGEKAFCAGGDIRAIYESYRGGANARGPDSTVRGPDSTVRGPDSTVRGPDSIVRGPDTTAQQSGPQDTGRPAHREFFAREYALDHLLRFYPKPVVVDMNGITMGGGMGLAQGSRLRIVGDRSRVAMPEVGIGFFPDVGGSYFLSRLPGALGAYLGLTGTPIRAADALYVGLADYYLPPAAFETLHAALHSLAWSGSDSDTCRADLVRLVARLAVEPGEARLAALRAPIDEHFAAASVAQLFASLQAEARPQYAAWAVDTLTLLRSRSPTSLAVTLHQLRMGRSMNFAQCLRMEFGMVDRCLAQGDFLEGVRALIIDKDNSPRWRPARLEDVTPESVAAIFQDPWAGGEHPLAGLAST